ncbi:MAG: endonuclease III [Candidatus Eisenbacteria bacterium]|nr:endonuclease III [Candidatus Eisenbacteria bacterium]
MARESKKSRRTRTSKILRTLSRLYPEAGTALRHENPFQLLVATILSAQCTDERVNTVTPVLFRKFPGPDEMAKAAPGEMEKIIKSTGFFRNKTKSVIGSSKAIVERFGGKVPSTMEELLTLPGVARKTANVVLGNGFGIAEGVVVDTHVHRLSNRLRLSTQKDPVKIEQDLMLLFPKKDWIKIADVLVLHGRSICKARTPLCGKCAVRKDCPCASHLR